MVIVLVPMMRIERTTSPLPRECSTTELHGRMFEIFKRPSRNMGREIANIEPQKARIERRLERVKGIEPSS